MFVGAGDVGVGVGVLVGTGVGVGVIQLQDVLPYTTDDIVAPIPVTVPKSTQSFITCGPIP